MVRGGDAAARALVNDPTEVYVIARVVSAVLGTLAIWFTYLAGAKLVDRRAGFFAAALMTVAFLPVFYSHLALNDAPTLGPAALALYGIARIYRHGRWWDFALAGLATGAATATKYTAAIFIVPICVAAYFRWRDQGGPLPHPWRVNLKAAWRWTVDFAKARAFLLLCFAGAATIAGFIIASPYSLLDPKTFGGGIIHQATASSSEGKLGQTFSNGYVYYLWSVTWGMGWVPAVAAIVGAFALARARNRVFWLLVPTAILYILFMGSASRWFGRWLLPLFPVLAVLAGIGAFFVVDALARRWPRARYAWVGLAAVLLLGQAVVYSIHSDRLLSRPDTRAQVRDWMVEHLPPDTKIAYEPVIPDAYYRQAGFLAPAPNDGNRWNIFFADETPQSTLTAATDTSPASEAAAPVRRPPRRLAAARQLPDSVLPNRRTQDPAWSAARATRATSRPRCSTSTGPAGSATSSRARSRPSARSSTRHVPDAAAYYRALRRQAKPVYTASPYHQGKSVKFNFDWSFDYYPLAYEPPWAADDGLEVEPLRARASAAAAPRAQAFARGRRSRPRRARPAPPGAAPAARRPGPAFARRAPAVAASPPPARAAAPAATRAPRDAASSRAAAPAARAGRRAPRAAARPAACRAACPPPARPPRTAACRSGRSRGAGPAARGHARRPRARRTRTPVSGRSQQPRGK